GGKLSQLADFLAAPTGNFQTETLVENSLGRRAAEKLIRLLMGKTRDLRFPTFLGHCFGLEQFREMRSEVGDWIIGSRRKILNKSRQVPRASRRAGQQLDERKRISTIKRSRRRIQKLWFLPHEFRERQDRTPSNRQSENMGNTIVRI